MFDAKGATAPDSAITELFAVETATLMVLVLLIFTFRLWLVVVKLPKFSVCGLAVTTLRTLVMLDTIFVIEPRSAPVALVPLLKHCKEYPRFSVKLVPPVKSVVVFTGKEIVNVTVDGLVEIVPLVMLPWLKAVVPL